MSRFTLTIPGDGTRATKKCSFCGEEFDFKVYKQRRYCSHKCRQNAYLERNSSRIEKKQELIRLTTLKARLERRLANLSSHLHTVSMRLKLLEEK